MTTIAHKNNEKYLVNCHHGANDIERATISFILAVSASKTAKAAVFITSDASYLCTHGGTKGLVSEGFEPIEDLINQFVSNGGKIWLCPVCTTTKGIKNEDLRPGVEITGAPRTMEFLANGGKLLA